jgi:hypothetical protein
MFRQFIFMTGLPLRYEKTEPNLSGHHCRANKTLQTPAAAVVQRSSREDEIVHTT